MGYIMPRHKFSLKIHAGARIMTGYANLLVPKPKLYWSEIRVRQHCVRRGVSVHTQISMYVQIHAFRLYFAIYL